MLLKEIVRGRCGKVHCEYRVPAYERQGRGRIGRRRHGEEAVAYVEVGLHHKGTEPVSHDYPVGDSVRGGDGNERARGRRVGGDVGRQHRALDCYRGGDGRGRR